MTVAFRSPNSGDDRDFIVSAWSTSYKRAHSAGLIQSEDWAEIMHRQIPKLLTKHGTRALVAYEKTDPTFLYGFIAGDTTTYRLPIVHYVFVKENYRRAGWDRGRRVGDGYARALFGALGVDPLRPFVYTCKTGVVTDLIAAKKILPVSAGTRFNPLVARYPKSEETV